MALTVPAANVSDFAARKKATEIGGGHYSQDHEVAEAGLAILDTPDTPGG
jgi:hypothetical protein